MSWSTTRERTRILREVSAHAAVDMSGALPWREEWGQYFDGPTGLVAALRARWHRMCEAQLDVLDHSDDLMATYRRLRRTEAGVLRILDRAGEHTAPPTFPAVPTPGWARPAATTPRSRRPFRLAAGPALPR
jgi:hypothetical protein